MEITYSPLYDSACMAIGSNGFKILEMPKYAGKIAYTHVLTLSSGFVSVQWLDKDRKIIAENAGGLREWYPMIGEIEEEKA